MVDSSFISTICVASFGIGIYLTYLFMRLCSDVHEIRNKLINDEEEE